MRGWDIRMCKLSCLCPKLIIAASLKLFTMFKSNMWKIKNVVYNLIIRGIAGEIYDIFCCAKFYLCDGEALKD